MRSFICSFGRLGGLLRGSGEKPGMGGDGEKSAAGLSRAGEVEGEKEEREKPPSVPPTSAPAPADPPSPSPAPLAPPSPPASSSPTPAPPVSRPASTEGPGVGSSKGGTKFLKKGEGKLAVKVKKGEEDALNTTGGSEEGPAP
mmetsp:Transcript_42557/g.99896  ORF Transcript_42557/g.99896 Transcript_42557/m.99896 type:complete len:143 (-) Transcript_42557:16-444(-)